MAAKKTLFQQPIFWVGSAGVLIAAFVLTEPEATAPKSTTKKSSTSKKSAKKVDDEFTKEDEKAEFKRVNEAPKNSFVPVVARHSGIGSADGMANSIPTEMTGGQDNWVYTGTAESDGVRVALVENRTTGDATFLKRGERWKSAVVVSVTEYSVILRGPSGTRTFGLVDEEVKTSSSSVARSSNNDFAPARVTVPSALPGNFGPGRFSNNFGGGPGQTQGLEALPTFPGNEPQ